MYSENGGATLLVCDRRQEVVHERQVQHLLGGDVRDHLPPPENRLQLLGAQPLVLALLEREGGKQVLAHDPVLELGRLAEHVDQRLAMLDNEGLFRRCQAAARGDHLGQLARSSSRNHAVVRAHSEPSHAVDWNMPGQTTLR
jgi:hypothetical protein